MSRYAIALVAVLAATILRVSLDPAMVWKAPFVFFAIAILFTARYHGFGPGVAATAFSLIASYFIVEPHFSLLHPDAAEAFSFALFSGFGIIISLISSQLRDSLHVSLREQERLKLITDTVPEFVCTATPEGACDFMNSRWYAYTGTEPGSALGTGWLRTPFIPMIWRG